MTTKVSDERLRELQDRILKEREAGNIVFWGLPNKLAVAKLDDFIKQPASGILYDLNRLEEVVLTFLADHKWVNDFAVATVIRRLHSDIATLRGELQEKLALEKECEAYLRLHRQMMIDYRPASNISRLDALLARVRGET